MTRHELAWVTCPMLLLLPLLGSAETATGALSPEGFAFQKAIEIQTSDPLHAVSLDLEVYQGSVEPRLADVRVFDARDRPVPHALRALPVSEGATVRREVPLLPLREPRPAATSGSRVEATLSPEQARVEIESSTLDATPQDALVGFLIDAGSLDLPIIGLEFSLEDGAPDFVAELRVEAGDDLDHFRLLSRRAVIARLSQEIHRVEQRSIELRPTRARYVRVRWPVDAAPPPITRATALLRAREQTAPPIETRIEATPDPERPGVLRFDLGGALPLEQVRVELAGRNPLLEVELWTSPALDASPTRRHQGLAYALGERGEIRSPAIPLGRGTVRVLELHLRPDATGPGSELPALRVTWLPRQLLFVAQGVPPYRLLYGRSGADSTAFDARALPVEDRAHATELQTSTATLGPQQLAGGVTRLTPPPPPFPVARVALWSVLILVVAGVVALSLSLLRASSRVE